MAVFRQELNWSEYQNRQLRVLEDIERSMSDNLVISKNLFSNMSKIEYAITSIAHASETSAKNLSAITKDLIGHSEEFNSRMEHASSVTRDFTLSLGDSNNSLREFDRRVDSAGNTLTSTIGNIATTLWEHLGGLRKIGEYTDKFSDASNQMIKLSGMDGGTVRDFRSEVMSIVAELNMSTGSAYSPLASYDKLISVSQGITSNLDAIQEMARPLLLTQEALDVDMSTVADLFNRFYTRYSFSSEHMESTLDEIRGNTAGNSANAEATFENIASLESYIGLIAGNDNDIREKLLEEVSQYTSFYENLGLDSGIFTDYMKQIIGGKYEQDTLSILASAGLGPGDALNMLRSGNLGGVAESLLEGVANIAGTYWESGTFNYARALENKGLDVDFASAAYNAVTSKNYKNIEEFLADQANKNPESLEKLVEDKFVSAADKANNWLEQIYSKIASIQEYLPFGVSDIVIAIALAKGMFGGSGGSGGAAGGAGLMSSLARGGRNLGAGAHSSTAAASAVGALGVAGIAAGVGMGVYGLSAGLDDFENGNTGYGLTNLAGGGLALGGAGALGAGMLGAGAAAGPIGWIGLGAGAIALAGRQIHESITPISGAASSIEKEFDNLTDSIYAEQMERVSQLDALERSIEETDDLAEATRIARESGLLPLKDEASYTKGALFDMIEAIKNANTALLNLQTASNEAAEGIIMSKAEEQDDEVKRKLFDSIHSYMGDDGALDKGDEGYELSKQVFTQIANSITDEEARKAALADIKSIYSNDHLSYSELKFLVDAGGYSNLRAGFSLELDRKDNMFRQSRDFEAINGALGLLGIDGYDLSEKDSVTKLNDVYSAWVNATTDTDKSKLASQFGKIYSSLSPEVKQVYKKQAKELGINALDVGTNFVERDQLALIHEGEAVVPRRYNPAANIEEIRMIANSVEESQSRATAETKEVMLSFIEELAEIKELLSEWKKDNKLAEIKSRHSANSKFINSFMAIEN